MAGVNDDGDCFLAFCLTFESFRKTCEVLRDGFQIWLTFFFGGGEFTGEGSR